MKVPVLIDIPDGWELAEPEMRMAREGDCILTHPGEVFGPVIGTIQPLLRVILRPAFVWPPWIKADYLAMGIGGTWYAFNGEPASDDTGWHTQGRLFIIDPYIFDFVPPPCTDWRQSLRTNPHAK